MNNRKLTRLAFLASGAGSSMRAIIAACRSGRLPAEPVLAVSNKADSPALAFAAEQGLATLAIPTVKNPDVADERLTEALRDQGVDLVILSGYLRKIGPKTLKIYEKRILNIHPALLPDFGGQGMYGRRVHEAVRASGVTKTGATVHWVDGEYDHGAIVRQAEVPVTPDDTVEDIQRKVVAREPELFVEALAALLERPSNAA